MAYRQKLKSLTDALGDLGNKVSDEKLLTILRGLNKKFSTIIATKDMFPTFLRARSLLVLDEAKHNTPPNLSTVLYSSTNPNPCEGTPE